MRNLQRDVATMNEDDLLSAIKGRNSPIRPLTNVGANSDLIYERIFVLKKAFEREFNWQKI